MKRDGEALRRADDEALFAPWAKIGRLNRPVIVTEKIDGTNACVIVAPDGQVFAQSRKRVINVKNDNFGFAAFVQERSAALADLLGEGYHYGEWYGHGIQRGYGLHDRWLALFNVERWRERERELMSLNVCTVPVLGSYPSMLDACVRVPHVLNDLRKHGSFVFAQNSPPFLNAEGVVLHHKQSGVSFKVTLEGDDVPKSHATAS